MGKEFFKKLVTYHNVVYIVHILVVAPLLLGVSYLGLKKSPIDNVRKMNLLQLLLVIQGSIAITVVTYHAYLLYSSMS